MRDGYLTADSPVSGTFALYVQPDGTLHEEDSRRRYLALRNDAGSLVGISSPELIVNAALAASADGDTGRSTTLLELVADEQRTAVGVGRALATLLGGQAERAERELVELAAETDPAEIEGRVNAAGYSFLQTGKVELARDVLALNTRVFPDAFNTWDSLGEAQMTLENHDEAIRCYEKSLALNPENHNAAAMIEQIQGGS